MEGLLASLEEFDWQGILVLLGLRIAGALLIVVVGIWLARRLALGSQRALDRAGLDPMLTGFLRNVAYAVLVAVVLIAAVGTLGVHTTSLLAVLGAAGLAIGLALQGSLSNIAAGMMLITLRPFRSGDFVKVAGEEGSVERVEVFQTMLRTPDNRLVTLPNSQITAAPIVNFTANTRRRADIPVAIAHDADVAGARQVLLAVVAGQPGVLPDPAPVVLATGLGEGSVGLEARAWIATADYVQVRSDLVEAIHRGLAKAGIGKPSPRRDVQLRLSDAAGQALARLRPDPADDPADGTGALQSG